MHLLLLFDQWKEKTPPGWILYLLSFGPCEIVRNASVANISELLTYFYVHGCCYKIAIYTQDRLMVLLV